MHFLRLTTLHTDKQIWLSVPHIQAIEEASEGSTITMLGAAEFDIKQTPDEVFSALDRLLTRATQMQTAAQEVKQ